MGIQRANIHAQNAFQNAAPQARLNGNGAAAGPPGLSVVQPSVEMPSLLAEDIIPELFVSPADTFRQNNLMRASAQQGVQPLPAALPSVSSAAMSMGLTSAMPAVSQQNDTNTMMTRFVAFVVAIFSLLNKAEPKAETNTSVTPVSTTAKSLTTTSEPAQAENQQSTLVVAGRTDTQAVTAVSEEENVSEIAAAAASLPKAPPPALAVAYAPPPRPLAVMASYEGEYAEGEASMISAYASPARGSFDYTFTSGGGQYAMSMAM